MFKRIANLIRGFLGLFISGIEKKSPEALLEVEKENLREQIAKYNRGLAAHAGLCERLMTQVKQQSREEEELRAKAAAALKAGSRELAGQYALRLQAVRKNLAENRGQLEEAEKTYRELVEARDVTVRQVKAKIEELKRGISDMKVKQATAELSEMASGMVTEIGGSGDTLNRLHEMVEEEREKAAGRARVARDSIDTTDIKMKKAEQDAMADLALADLAAELGMEVPAAAEPTPAATPPASERTMGPAKSESTET
jgi:phage shock protein A